jgi:hypothetical protein
MGASEAPPIALPSDTALPHIPVPCALLGSRKHLPSGRHSTAGSVA